MTVAKLNINVNRFRTNLLKHLESQMFKVVIYLESYVKTNFGPSNQGGRNPSAPGKAPNIGLGTLRNSITHDVRIEENEVIGRFGVRKGPATTYAKRLELGFFGTDKRGRNINQEPRPYLVPAYRINKRKITKMLTR